MALGVYILYQQALSEDVGAGYLDQVIYLGLILVFFSLTSSLVISMLSRLVMKCYGVRSGIVPSHSSMKTKEK